GGLPGRCCHTSPKVLPESHTVLNYVLGTLRFVCAFRWCQRAGSWRGGGTVEDAETSRTAVVTGVTHRRRSPPWLTAVDSPPPTRGDVGSAQASRAVSASASIRCPWASNASSPTW